MRFGLFVIVFGASSTFIDVHGKPVHDLDAPLSTRGTRKIDKRHEDSSTDYLEQCGTITFPNVKPGFVNVIAFLDSSWPYSHRQAIMLKMLHDRLQKSGLSDTLFIVINADQKSSQMIDTTEDEIEKEAWLGVSPDEIEAFADIVKTTDSLATSMAPGIQVVQDNEDINIWKKFGGSRDQVLVVDRCGRLTYQVIVPWSILHFPYVKAAILSTYNDEPCGPCDVEAAAPTLTLDFDIQSENEASTTELYFQNVKKNRTPPETEYLLAIDSAKQDGTTLNYIQNQDTYATIDPVTESFTEKSTTSTTITNIADPDPTKIQAVTTSSYTHLVDLNATNNTFTETSERTNQYETANHSTDDETVDFQKPQIFRSEEKFVIPQSAIIKSDSTESTDNVTNNDEIATARTNNYADVSITKENLNSTNDNNNNSSIKKEDDANFGNTEISYIDPIANKNENDTTETFAEKIVNENSAKEFRAVETTKEDIDSVENVKIGSEENREIDETSSFDDFPIRIIMHAPHFHADRDSTRMHEYLVLKTGSSDHHRHLGSYGATRLYRGPQDFHEKPEYHRRMEIETKEWPMANVIYNRDESPGLYGEIADYWKNSANSENHEYAEESENSDYEENTKEPNAEEIIWQPVSMTTEMMLEKNDKIVDDKTTTLDIGPDLTTEASKKFQIHSGKDVSDERAHGDRFYNDEEEKRSRLIAHYSKLLPWIYYVLDK